MAEEPLTEQQTRTDEAGAERAPASEAPADAAAEAAQAPEGGAEPAGGEDLQRDLTELEQKAAERDEYLALAQRAQADFENYRKRVARDLAAAESRGVAKVVKELLPALDNLDRALAAVEAHEGEAGADEADHLTKGIRLVQQELAASLERVGVQAFSPKGEAFDPNLHEAMAQQPVEGAASGTVVEVYQQGYQLNGTVIRPARVVVAA